MSARSLEVGEDDTLSARSLRSVNDDGSTPGAASSRPFLLAQDSAASLRVPLPQSFPGYEGFVKNQTALRMFMFTQGDISTTFYETRRSELLAECHKRIAEFRRQEQEYYGSDEGASSSAHAASASLTHSYPRTGHSLPRPALLSPSLHMASAPERPRLGEAKASDRARDFTVSSSLPKLGGVLQPRDLRIMDPSFTSSLQPSLLVRQCCILVNLKPVKAILLPGRVYFFPAQGADSELSLILARLRAPSDETSAELPFEYKALEAFLMTVVDQLSRETTLLEQETVQFVNCLVRNKVTVRTFASMKACREAISSARALAEGVSNELSDVLDSPESLAMMAWPFCPWLLSRDPPRNRAARGSQPLPEADAHTQAGHSAASASASVSPDTGMGVGAGTGTGTDNGMKQDLEVDAAELLLESYLSDVEAIYRRLGRCRDNLTSAEHQYHLVLNAARNQMIRVNLFITVTTMFAGVAMFVPAIFGMNLTSGLEKTPRVFERTVIITAAALVFLVLVSYKLLSAFAL